MASQIGRGPRLSIRPGTNDSGTSTRSLNRRAFLAFSAEKLAAAAVILDVGWKLTSAIPEWLYDHSGPHSPRKTYADQAISILMGGMGREVAGLVGDDLTKLHVKEGEITPADDTGALHALISLLPKSESFRDLSSTACIDLRTYLNSAICAASPITNTVSRSVMWDALQSRSAFDLAVPGHEKQALRLKYNFDREDATEYAPISRYLDHTSITEANHRIRSWDSNFDDLRSEQAPDGTPTTGFLLISKLPHPWQAESVVLILSGNTGPATEGFRLFLTDEFLGKNLENIERKIHGARYFQILCQAKDIEFDSSKGRHMANHLELWDAYSPPFDSN